MRISPGSDCITVSFARVGDWVNQTADPLLPSRVQAPLHKPLPSHSISRGGKTIGSVAAAIAVPVKVALSSASLFCAAALKPVNRHENRIAARTEPAPGR